MRWKAKLRRRRPTRKDMQHAARAAYVGGVLMLVSGTVGSTALLRLGYAILSDWLPFLDPLLVTAMAVAAVVAGLGGVAVLAGGMLVHRGLLGGGRLLITLGTGSGIVGLTLHLLLATFEGHDPVAELVTIGSTVSGIGVLLTIYARLAVSDYVIPLVRG